jgi:plasmid stabilization system protein ParE
MPYRLSALAEQDLEEIWSYVAVDATPATADRLIDAIIDRFELLSGQPPPSVHAGRPRRTWLQNAKQPAISKNAATTK